MVDGIIIVGAGSGSRREGGGFSRHAARAPEKRAVPRGSCWASAFTAMGYSWISPLRHTPGASILPLPQCRQVLRPWTARKDRRFLHRLLRQMPPFFPIRRKAWTDLPGLMSPVGCSLSSPARPGSGGRNAALSGGIPAASENLGAASQAAPATAYAASGSGAAASEPLAPPGHSRGRRAECGRLCLSWGAAGGRCRS